MAVSIDGGPSDIVSAFLEEPKLYSSDTKIFIWPEPDDVKVSRKDLESLCTGSIGGTAPTIVGRGFFPRQYMLLYQPGKEMTQEQIDSLLNTATGALNQELSPHKTIRASYNIQDETGGNYSAGQRVYVTIVYRAASAKHI